MTTSATNHSEEEKTAADHLKEGAETYRQRQEEYGKSYETFGDVMCALLPEGLRIEAGNRDGFVRLGVFVQIISKLTRYTGAARRGGHKDSAHDLMVYAAILEEVTREK